MWSPIRKLGVIKPLRKDDRVTTNTLYMVSFSRVQ